MNLSVALHEVMSEFIGRNERAEHTAARIEARDCWNLSIRCELPQFPGLCIRNLKSGDLAVLEDFGTKLGAVSRYLFCPYPWDDHDALSGAFQKAIDQAVERIDASYLMEVAGYGVIGHFFLWKAGGNPHSQQHRVQVPELGVAIADDWQGKGLGSLSVRILQMVARDLSADAIELTTAMTNNAGWNTYRRCGFEYVGIIRNPLEVDVTAAVAGEVQASKYREERQMVYMINEEHRQRVLDYLTAKREASVT